MPLKAISGISNKWADNKDGDDVEASFRDHNSIILKNIEKSLLMRDIIFFNLRIDYDGHNFLKIKKKF
jgi:hypothetical protein